MTDGWFIHTLTISAAPVYLNAANYGIINAGKLHHTMPLPQSTNRVNQDDFLGPTYPLPGSPEGTAKTPRDVTHGAE